MEEARRTQFAALVGSWLPGIYGYYRKLGLDAAAAEDLAQETFLTAWRSLASLRDPEKMRSWLYGTAYRLYLRHRRKRRAPSSLETMAEAALPAGEDPGSESSLARHALRDAVQGLPESFRQPLVLVYWQDLSYEEAARALSLPLGTLAWRVNKALRLLRQTLAEEGATHGSGPARRRPAVGGRNPVGKP